MPQESITVVGAGIVGSCTAYYLAAHPSKPKVTLVEATEIAAGASGKSGGFLARDWHGTSTSSLGSFSFDLHSQLAKEYDGEKNWGYRRVKTLSVSTHGMYKKSSSGNESGKGVLPWLNSNVNLSATLGDESTTAQVHPGQFTKKIVEIAQEKFGLEVVTGQVIGYQAEHDENNQVSLTLKDGSSIKSDQVVITAGPWTGTIFEKIYGDKSNNKLGSNRKCMGIEGSRAHSIVVKPQEELTPHVLFTEVSSGTPEIYSRPDGTAYICGATDDEALPETAGQVTTDRKSIKLIKSQAAELSSKLDIGTSLGGKLIAEQACYLPISTRTGSPLVGKVSDKLWIAAGHSCWGISLGPGTGKVMSELILDGKATSADIAMLRP